MNESKVDDIVQDIIDLFPRPNPIMAAVITEDLGLVNGTPAVLVDLRGADVQAIYLPPLVPEVPGNCWVVRMNPELDSPLYVLATNFQVDFHGGWGSGEQEYIPPELGSYQSGDTSSNQYGWGDQPWGR